MAADWMSVADEGVEDGIEWATANAPLYGAINGYVKVPEDHPWHGLDYDDIDVEINGGLTYARDGWIGFDTLHSGDYWPGCPDYWLDDHSTQWTAALVAEETRSLARQVAAARVPA